MNSPRELEKTATVVLRVRERNGVLISNTSPVSLAPTATFMLSHSKNDSVTVCVGVNRTREVFEISAFGDNRVYRIIYANILYFVVIHGGPLLFIAFFNMKLINALKHRQRRRAEMGKNWFQQDVSLVLVVVMCVFIVCQTPTFIDHILSTSPKNRHYDGSSIFSYSCCLSSQLLTADFCVKLLHNLLRRVGVQFIDHILPPTIDRYSLASRVRGYITQSVLCYCRCSLVGNGCCR